MIDFSDDPGAVDYRERIERARPLLAERSDVRVCLEPPIVCCAAPMEISDIENAFNR